jgi:Protein of unknown function (DUF2811)
MTDQLTRPTDFTISCLVEIPEKLHEQLQSLSTARGWDFDQAFKVALCLLLIQESGSPDAARLYLEATFGHHPPAADGILDNMTSFQ